jgi:hypothetical protein
MILFEENYRCTASATYRRCCGVDIPNRENCMIGYDFCHYLDMIRDGGMK